MNRDKIITKRIAEEINELGGSVYYVGGYVRDSILGRENKDIDIEVYGVTPEKLKKVCRKIGRVDEVGASFGVLKIHGCDIDITMPRKERATGIGHKDFKVNVDPFMATKEAASRRDFTINAIMKNVLTGEIIDHYDGMKDLNERSIRHIINTSFVEDPLRVFRAAGFASRLGFTIADETIELCKGINIATLPNERIYEETNKVLLKAEKPSIYFECLMILDKIKCFFPELDLLHSVEQDPVYHPEGDAWVHTMMVLDNAATKRHEVLFPLGFMYSALFHDIGKPMTTVFDNDKKRIVSYGHEIAGVDESKRALKRITNNKQLIQYVQNMVEFHMKPHFTPRNASYKTTNRFLDKIPYPKDLILLSLCDKLGRQEIDPRLARFWDDRLKCYKEIMKKPEVTGDDLISFGYKPGPEFRTILKQCHRIHLAGVSKEDVIRHLPSIVNDVKSKKIK